MNLLARGEAQDLLGVLGDDGANGGQVNGITGIVGQAHVTREVKAVGHHVDLHGLGGVPMAHRDGVNGDRQEALDLRVRVEVPCHALKVRRGGHEHEVIAADALLAVLPGGE